MLPVAAYLILKTPLYEVKMKILIKSARSQVAMNLAGPTQGFITPAVTPQLVNSEVQIMKSNDLLIPAIQQSGYQLLPPGTEDTPIIRERKLMELRLRMLFTPVPDSNVIEVSIQDPDAKQAGRLLSTLATLYLKKRAEPPGGERRHARVLRQAGRRSTSRSSSTRATRSTSSRRSSTSSRSSQEIEQNLIKLMALEATLKDLQAEIDSTTREIAVLEAQ